MGDWDPHHDHDLRVIHVHLADSRFIADVPPRDWHGPRRGRANVISFAAVGNACGYILAGFAGDAMGMRRWYAISIILSQIIVIPLFVQTSGIVVLVAALLFFQQMFGQGVSGLLPKWVSSYFPVEKRAAGLGFCYNVGALGGAVGPVLGASIAAKTSLGVALAIMSVGFALIVVVSIGLNLPKVLQKAVNPDAVRPEDGDDETIAAIAAGDEHPADSAPNATDTASPAPKTQGR